LGIHLENLSEQIKSRNFEISAEVEEGMARELVKGVCQEKLIRETGLDTQQICCGLHSSLFPRKASVKKWIFF